MLVVHCSHLGRLVRPRFDLLEVLLVQRVIAVESVVIKPLENTNNGEHTWLCFDDRMFIQGAYNALHRRASEDATHLVSCCRRRHHGRSLAGTAAVHTDVPHALGMR